MAKGFAIFLKEWREMLRDQRVIFGVFIGPLLFTIGIFAMLGVTTRKMGETARKSVITIAVVQQQKGQTFLKPLEMSKRFKIIEVHGRPEGEQKLKQGEARLLLDFSENEMPVEAGLSLLPGAGREAPVRIKIYYDPSDQQSEIALQVIRAQMAEMNKAIAQERLKMRGLDPGLIEPFKADTQPLEGRSQGFILVLIPYFLMLWSLIGGMTIASDLVAGEKERGTMETLLTSPATRLQVVTGKFMALLSQAWIGLLIQVIGLGIGWQMMMGEDTRQAELNLTPGVLLITFIAILPYSVFNTALLFALSTYARNQREAQGYVTAVSFILMIPLILAQFMGFFAFSREWWVGLLPVLNVFQVVRNALSGQLDMGLFCLTMVSMSLLALIGLWFAISLFRRESVLFRV